MVDEERMSTTPAVGSADGGPAPGVTERTTAEIVNVLTAIAELHEEGGRSIFVQLISEALGTPLFPRHSNPKFYLYDVVRLCRETPEGVAALIHAVDWLVGGTTVAGRLRRMLSPVRDVLEPADETAVEELLHGLRVPSLARLYHAAMGGGLAPVPHRLGDAWDAFGDLLDRNTPPDGLPPHLAFICLLLHAVRHHRPADTGDYMAARDVRRVERLHEWLKERIGELRRTGAKEQATRLERMLERPEPGILSAGGPIYLVIQLEPVPDLGEGELMVRLSHWRQVHPTEWRPEPGPDRVVPFSGLEDEVAALVVEAEEGWAYQFVDDRLVLEFILPMDMIDLAVDQWTRDPPEAPHRTPLGSEYEVVVRSYERQYDRSWHRAWRQRWHMLADPLGGAVDWGGRKDGADSGLGHQWPSRRETVAYVLGGPPHRDPGRAELWMALRAGIPIVLWHRAEEPSPEYDEALREMLGASEILRLPGNVKRLRGTAPSSEKWCDLQVALLWDDPDRLVGDGGALRPPGRNASIARR